MSNFLMHPDPLSSPQCVAPWTESFQGHKFFSRSFCTTKPHRHCVNSLYSGHCRDLELVSSLARVHDGESLFQSNVCNLFLPGISCYPYYRGVCKARADGISITHGFKGDLPNKIKYKTTWKSTIGDEIVETLYSNGITSENKRIRTPLLPPLFKVGVFVVF